jgi:hypothetical protein
MQAPSAVPASYVPPSVSYVAPTVGNGAPSFPQQAPGVAQQTAPATVKAQIGDWLICQDAQGEFYQDSRGQSYDQPPPALLSLLHAQAHSSQSGAMTCAASSAQASLFATPAPAKTAPTQMAPVQMAQTAAQGQVHTKGQIGDWLILEDAQGEFYQYAPTGQQFDQPPAELIQLVQMQGQR